MKLISKLRPVFALLVLGAFMALYSGMPTGTGLLPQLMKTQLSAGAVGYGYKAVVVLIFMGAAIFFGRAFCSVFCPFGTAQELFCRAGRRVVKKSRRFAYVKPWRLRYLVLLLAIVGIIFGIAPLVVATDPISNFGRGFGALLSLTKDGFLSQPPIVYLSLAVFIFIMGWAFFRGRRFCDWCPAGMALGAFAYNAPLSIGIDTEACTSCGLCERSCPSNCIDSKNKSVDSERCVLCLSCLSACPQGGIGYGGGRYNSPQRREFGRAMKKGLTLGIMGLLYSSAANFRALAETVRKPPSPAGGTRILPPGAVSANHYSARCVACQACVKACPVKIIKIKTRPQPELDYSGDYCQYECTRCGEACPTGAIRRLEVDDKRRTRVALSRLTLGNCVVVDKSQACGACAEVCPTRALVMKPYGATDSGLTVPDFDERYCIGCGACIYACPAEPSAFIMEPSAVQVMTPGIRPSSDEEGLPPLPTLPGEHDFPF